MGNGEYKWVNNGQKFELMTKDTFIVTKQSPFHWMNTMVTGGREWTKMEHTRNIFFDKVNKAQMINKMKMEHVHKIMMTEESPVYGLSYWYTGRYGKNVERKMTVFFDKINKSILFVPKMKMD